MNPLLQQYQAIKAKYPDALLLFRVGDYYECFGEDAKVISKHLGLPLTQSSNNDVQVMAGFPFPAVDNHLRTLVKAGYRVAICEPLEGAKTTKGIGKREA